MPLCKTCKCNYKIKYLTNGQCKLCISEVAAGTVKACSACGLAIASVAPAVSPASLAGYCAACYLVKLKKDAKAEAAKPKYLCKAGCNAPLYKPGTCGACQTAANYKPCAQCGQSKHKLTLSITGLCHACILKNKATLAQAAAAQVAAQQASPTLADAPPTCAMCGGHVTPENVFAAATDAVAKGPTFKIVPLCDPCAATKVNHDAAKLEQQKAKKAKMASMLGTLPQKVKGIKVLPEAYPHSQSLDVLHFQTSDAIQASSHYMWNDSTPLFLRPCPTVPCHGFVDSRPTETSTATTRKLEAITLLESVLAKDPGGALLVCRYIPSRRNAIVTPHSIIFGDGHDGATMGKDTVTIPLTPGKTRGIVEELAWKASLADEEVPYVEVVFPETPSHDHDYTLTQLRSGPAVGGRDLIPTAMVVEEIYDCVVPGEDAEGWPAKLKAMKKPGLVVFQEGGSVGCHFGANCAFHKVAYMSSRRPKIGESLKATKDLPPEAPNQRAFQTGFLGALETTLAGKDDYSRAVSYLLAVTHSAPALSEGVGTKYIGAACAYMLRLGTAASLGEMRHHHHQGFKAKAGKSRQQIFRSVLNEKGSTTKKFLDFRRKLVAAQVCFARDGWAGSFGGLKWAECALATLELDSACIDYLRQRGGNDLSLVCEKLHAAVNKAHNNGWWLNKFTTKDFFDKADAGNLDVTLHGLSYFERLSRLSYYQIAQAASKVKSLQIADSCLVVAPQAKARQRAIIQAQYCWYPGGQSRIHVQFKHSDSTATQPYDRHDFIPTPEQADLLTMYQAELSESDPSWSGSGERKYFPLTIFPGSTVAGVTIAGIFRAVVTLTGNQA